MRFNLDTIKDVIMHPLDNERVFIWKSQEGNTNDVWQYEKCQWWHGMNFHQMYEDLP